MASLYDPLCYHSLTSTDPLLEEILSYLPTSFHSHIFDYIAYEHSPDEESVHSIASSASAFYSDDSTYFSEILLCPFFLNATPKLLPQGQAEDSKKRLPIENDRRPRRSLGGPKLLENRRSWPATPVVQGARRLSTPRTTGATTDG